MPEAIRPYRQGDSVVAARCLVTGPVLDSTDHVEIPAASRGTVTGYIPGTDRPYLVVFEAGDGRVVEMNVAARDIGRVRPHPPVIPLIPAEVLSAAYAAPRRAAHAPTYRRPHRLCRPLHSLIYLEVCVAYGLVLDMQPVLLPLVTVALAALVYGHQWWVHGRLALVPDLFHEPELCECEERIIDPRRVRYAVLVDFAVVVSLGSLLVHYWAVWPTVSPGDVVRFASHIALVGLFWVTKAVIHDLTSRIVLKKGGERSQT
jgi:hypothetical protein